MKTYIMPNITVVKVEVKNHLLTVSGSGEQLSGSYNGEYTDTGGITLGAKGGGMFWSDDDFAYEDYEE